MIYLCTDLDGGPPGVSHVLVVKPPGGGGGHTPGVGWMCAGCGWQFSYDVPEARAHEVWLEDERHQRTEASPASADIYHEIKAERARAHAKHGEHSMESSDWTSMRRLRILVEEVGEVAKAFNEADLGNLTEDELATEVRKELIQTAAMAAAWADAVPLAGEQ